MQETWNMLVDGLGELKRRPGVNRIPFFFVLVLCIVTLCKVMLVLTVQYMCDHGMVVYTGTYPSTSPLLLALGYQWDTRHFISIAENGYASPMGDTLLFSFAPLYPALIALSWGIVGNPCLAAVIVSNVFYFGSLPVCYLVARLYMDYRFACLTTLILGVFPTYIAYGTFGYSEAPYTFFAMLTWLLYKKDRMFLASVALTLSVFTRYVGLLALIVIFLLSTNAKFRKLQPGSRMIQAIYRGQVWLMIPAAATGLLFLYFQTISGNFLVVLASHASFDDHLTTPFGQFMWFFTGFFTKVNPSVNPVSLALERYIFTIPFFVLTLSLLKTKTASPEENQMNAELGLYGLAYMLITLSTAGISAVASPRIMLSSWVTLLALHREMSKTAMIVLAFLFFVVGLWVAFRFETTFFA